jgi:hypothetical protein
MAAFTRISMMSQIAKSDRTVLQSEGSEQEVALERAKARVVHLLGGLNRWIDRWIHVCHCRVLSIDLEAYAACASAYTARPWPDRDPPRP